MQQWLAPSLAQTQLEQQQVEVVCRTRDQNQMRFRPWCLPIRETAIGKGNAMEIDAAEQLELVGRLPRGI